MDKNYLVMVYIILVPKYSDHLTYYFHQREELKNYNETAHLFLIISLFSFFEIDHLIIQ